MSFEEIDALQERPWADMRNSLPMLQEAATAEQALAADMPAPVGGEQKVKLPTLDDLAREASPKLQQTATNLVHAAVRRRIVERHQQVCASEGANYYNTDRGRASALALARMHSTLGPGGIAAWIRASASAQSTQLNSLQYQTAVYLAIGIDHPSAVGDCYVCRQAGLRGDAATVDRKGYHYLSCKRGGNEISVRHNALRDRLAAILQRMHFDVKVEIQLHALGVQGIGGKERIDLAIRAPGSSVWELVDVTVVCPVASSYAKKVMGDADAAFTAIVAQKERTYKAAIEQDFKLTTFAGSVFGRFNLQAQDLLRRAARAGVRTGSVVADIRVESRMVDRLWQDLACTIQRGNHMAIASRSSREERERRMQRGRDYVPVGAAYMPEFRTTGMGRGF
jgi:hypothetical protein